MKAYKLFSQRKSGTLGPLFINRKQIIPIDRWLKAENIPTKGFAVRPGWHTAPSKAPYLSEKDRIWMEVEIKNYYKFDRPKNQGGYWLIANEMKVIGPA